MTETVEFWWIAGPILITGGVAFLIAVKLRGSGDPVGGEPEPAQQVYTGFLPPTPHHQPEPVHPSYTPPQEIIVSTREYQSLGLSFTAEISYSEVEGFDYSDGKYEAFVDEQWAKTGVDLSGIMLVRHVGPEEHPYRLHSLVEPYYLNCLDGITRKTFVPNRHRWTLDGVEVEPIAFTAIMRGVPPHVAFQPDLRPTTPAEAAAKNRHETADRKILLHYRNAASREAYRIISRPHRSGSGFTACCHYRYGERREFLFERVLSFSNATTGEVIEPEALFRGNRAKKTK